MLRNISIYDSIYRFVLKPEQLNKLYFGGNVESKLFSGYVKLREQLIPQKSLFHNIKLPKRSFDVGSWVRRQYSFAHGLNSSVFSYSFKLEKYSPVYYYSKLKTKVYFPRLVLYILSPSKQGVLLEKEFCSYWNFGNFWTLNMRGISFV